MQSLRKRRKTHEPTGLESQHCPERKSGEIPDYAAQKSIVTRYENQYALSKPITHSLHQRAANQNITIRLHTT